MSASGNTKTLIILVINSFCVLLFYHHLAVIFQ